MTVKFLIWVLMIAVMSGVNIAQERPKAILVDEFGKVTCEDFLARIDNFHIQLADKPNSVGLVMIIPDRNSIRPALWYKKVITHASYLRKFQRDQVKVVRADPGDAVRVKLWLIPSGAVEPPYSGSTWPRDSFDLSKPFVYDTVDENGICPTFVPQLYADLINSNPGVLGRIVVFPNSTYKKPSKKTAAEWMKTLTRKYSVPRDRLNLFYGKPSDFEYVEFWIVPVSKK